jgi:hypothetical protein
VATITSVALLLAAIAIIVVCVQAALILARLQVVAERVKSLLERETSETIQSWREAAQGILRSTAKLDDGLTSLNRSLDRIDRVTGRLETDLLAAAVLQPALAKVSGWLSGVKRGLTGVGTRHHGRGAENAVDTEVG